MEDLDKVNTERESIIKTLNSEKSHMEVLCNKKEEALEKEIDSPAYYGVDVVDMIKNFLEWNRNLRVIDQRIINEMNEWVKAVKRVVIGIESQESKLKEYQQMVDTLRAQIKKGITPEPVFKQPIDKVDEKIEKIESNRLTDEQLEKARGYFMKLGLKERLCYYLYNKDGTGTELDKYFELGKNVSNSTLKRSPDLFRTAGREADGRVILFRTTDEGKKLVEKIVRLGKTGKLDEYV
ncbi:hypothetical protein KKE60_07625 [Patescibacteria group bacterium]|nr:hypothetical protein [Patescibacteria group bacterium]